LPYVGGVDVLATKTLGINKFNCCPKKSENKQGKKYEKKNVNVSI